MITPLINNDHTNECCFRRLFIVCVVSTLTLAVITISTNRAFAKQATVSRVLEKRLNLVIKQNNVVELSKILDQGVNVDTKNRDGQTLLMIAGANPGSFSIMKLLLERGANPNERNSKGNSVLMFTVGNIHESESEKIKKIELLARYDVDPTYRVDGHTALNCLLLAESQEHKLHKGLAALEMRYSKARSASQKQSIN
jgi:ankyrin repeat protein